MLAAAELGKKEHSSAGSLGLARKHRSRALLDQRFIAAHCWKISSNAAQVATTARKDVRLSSQPEHVLAGQICYSEIQQSEVHKLTGP